jgi:hypothetical protein
MVSRYSAAIRPICRHGEESCVPGSKENALTVGRPLGVFFHLLIGRKAAFFAPVSSDDPDIGAGFLLIPPGIEQDPPTIRRPLGMFVPPDRIVRELHWIGPV